MSLQFIEFYTTLICIWIYKIRCIMYCFQIWSDDSRYNSRFCTGKLIVALTHCFNVYMYNFFIDTTGLKKGLQYVDQKLFNDVFIRNLKRKFSKNVFLFFNPVKCRYYCFEKESLSKRAKLNKEAVPEFQTYTECNSRIHN